MGQRSDLATAKLADLISPQTTASDYARILLNSSGNRATDDFIEVHIYGGFDINAIASVSGTSTPRQADDRGVVTVVKELLEKQGKKWLELP